jgi:hypothetical protein
MPCQSKHSRDSVKLCLGDGYCCTTCSDCCNGRSSERCLSGLTRQNNVDSPFHHTETTSGARNTVTRPSAPQTRFGLPEQATLHKMSNCRTGGMRVVGGSVLPHWQVLAFLTPKYRYPVQNVAQLWYVREVELVVGPSRREPPVKRPPIGSR